MLETHNRTHTQNCCTNPDHQRHYNHEFARGPCLAERYREAAPQWPGESQATRGQEVRREMRQIADHQRIHDSASQAPPAEQQATGDHGQDRVGEAAMPDRGGERMEITRTRRPTQDCG